MRSAVVRLSRFVRDDSAATMIEYGFMVALIAAVCVAVIMLVGTGTHDEFKKAKDCVVAPGSGSCP